MTKIVYNNCYGGFSLSEAAINRYLEIKGGEVTTEKNKIGFTRFYLNGKKFNDHDLDRTDPILVQVVEELGSAANGRFANLVITNVPAGTKYRIEEYDGIESVMTPEDYDWIVA